MAWSDAARAAALEARRRKSMRASDDNPGGSWLKHEMWNAARRLHAEKRGTSKYRGDARMTGSETFSLYAKLPTKLLTQLPGRNDEHKFIKPGDQRVADMAKYIKQHGSIKGSNGKFYHPFIQVNYRGEAYINEGNHRVRAYAAAGRKTIPVKIQYHAGGELRRGPVSLVTVIKYAQKKKR